MDAAIITIGDEILNGTTLDTNSAFISQQLNAIGINVKEIISISDKKNHILDTLHATEKKFEIIFITGGLGPTRDDVTKYTLCEYFNSQLVFNDDVYKRIVERFTVRNIPLSEKNKDQALLPHNCFIIANSVGTASGMWFEKNTTVWVSMPGVPYEMKEMMLQTIIPKIKTTFQLPVIINKHIMTSGVGESVIADKIEDIEDSLPEHIGLAYLPSPGAVKLRLTAKGIDRIMLQNEVDIFAAAISLRIQKYVYGYDGETLESAIGDLLLKLRGTVSTAESCTGGKIASRLSSVAGSSRYYSGSIISYSNEIKSALLFVSEETLEQYSAVSEEVVSEMLDGALKALKTDFAVAISGIAGPDGGTDEKPVGLMYIGVANEFEKRIKKYQLVNMRDTNIDAAATYALHDLRMLLVDCLAKASETN